MEWVMPDGNGDGTYTECGDKSLPLGYSLEITRTSSGGGEIVGYTANVGFGVHDELDSCRVIWSKEYAPDAFPHLTDEWMAHVILKDFIEFLHPGILRPES